MSDRPLISVVIPVYNEEKTFERCLNSLEKQSFNNFEVIVIDNGCIDKTIEIARKYKFTKVVKDFNTLGSARQTGLEKAGGSYVAFMDADEIADPSWLSELYKRRDDVDAVLGGIKPYESNTLVAQHFQVMLELDMLYFPLRIRNNSVMMFGCGNVLIDRQKALEIGFDKSFSTAEDGDFSYRFLQKGYTISYNPKALVYHHIPQSFTGFFKYYRKLALGSILLLKKHKNLDLIKNYFMSMFYPISPHYIWRVVHTKSISKSYFLLLGFGIFLAYLWNLIDFRTYSFRPRKKVLRHK